MNQQKPLVLITHSLPETWLEKLKGNYRIIAGPPEATELSPKLEQHLPEAQGLLTLLTIPISEEVLEKAPNLKVVSNMAVGYDNIDVEACTRLGIPVGNTPGVLTEGTADLTMALLLDAARRLPEATRDAREGRWTTWSPTGWLGADLHGATFGIFGMGKIGTAVARRAHAFGVKLVYTNRSPRPEVEKELGAIRRSLDQLLAESDFVSLHVPLTQETEGIIDAQALQTMKTTAILVNAARGPVVVSDDLLKALKEGWIAAAALDVTDPEPLPPSNPLYKLANCIITPHIGSATKNTRRRMAELACDNLLAGLEGRPLPHCVNPNVNNPA